MNEANPLNKTDDEIARSNRWFAVALALGQQDDFVAMLATERERAVSDGVGERKLLILDYEEAALVAHALTEPESPWTPAAEARAQSIVKRLEEQ